MKKITLFFAVFAATIFMTAQTTLSHSTSQTPINGTVACANSAGGFTLQNSFWRSYTPANFGFSGDFNVMGAEFGFSFTDNGGTTPTIDVTVNFYSTTPTFPSGTRTLIGSEVVTVGTAEHLTVVPVTLSTMATVDSNTEVVVEVMMPSGETAVFDARVAQNPDGENAPSYLSSPGCGDIPPTPISNLGNFPNSHIIVNLIGDSALSLNDNILSQVTIYPNPTTDVINVKNLDDVNITAVVLSDLLGKDTGVQLVNGQINLANLSKGVYLLQLKTDSGSLTQKVIKQ